MPPPITTTAAPKNERIGNATAILMILTALMVDGLQALLEWLLIGFAVNWLIVIFAYMMFWLWFKGQNVNFATNPKRIGLFSIGPIIEIIPIIGELPVLTATIALTILTVKLEDRISKIK